MAIHFNKTIRATGCENNFSMAWAIFDLKSIKNIVAIVDKKFGFLRGAVNG
jgi:hypothetical protein